MSVNWKSVLGIAAMMMIVSCDSPIGAEKLIARTPGLPEAWDTVLGKPSWIFYWYGPDGTKRSMECPEGSTQIDVPEAVASSVFAYPYWPNLGIEAEIFRPAGAVFPFDVKDSILELSWRGGIAAEFYKELLRAGGTEERRPEFFDWPRFIGLFDSEMIDQAARDDPWTVDWRNVAVLTRQSGFDRRRIKPRTIVPIRIAAPGAGPWVRTSPFAKNPVVAADGFLELEAAETPDSLFSEAGILRYSADIWAWFPRKDPETLSAPRQGGAHPLDSARAF